MQLVGTVIFFCYGLIFGSFFNVVGLRIPQNKSIVSPSSECSACHRKLTFLELVPLVSYVFLGGKCRNCNTKISLLYPFVEFATAVLFSFAFYKLGLHVELIVAILFVSLLMIIFVSDMTQMLIPDRILLPFAIALFLMRLFSQLDPWWESLIAALLGFSFLYLLAVISQGGIGGGDIKLVFVLGLVLGIANTFLMLFLAALIGSVVGFIVMISTKQSNKTPIPFGPSIAVGSIVSYFWGNQIVVWYGNMFY